MPLVLISLAVLIVVLGARQWRWLERMSKDEHYRLERSVGYAAWLLKEVVDHEMTVLARSFEAPAGGRDDGDPDLARRLQAWRSATRWPGLLKEVYRVSRDSAGELRIDRLDPDSGSLVPDAWPAELEPVRRSLLADRAPEAPIGGVAAVAAVPALLVRSAHPPAAAAAGAGRADPGIFVLHLDREHIAQRFFPELVQMFFPPPTFPSIDVAIVETAEGGVLYSTLPIETAEQFGRTDVVLGLVEAATNPEEIDFAGRPPRGDEVIPSSQWEPTDEDRAWFRKLWARLFYSGHWQILVRHGGASIEDSVQALRQREMRMAFGVLAMLGFALALFVTGTHRAQRLARRQVDLVARISHELRTPLAVLGAAGDNLADSIVRDREQVVRYGRLIQHEARRLREITENVLYLARRNGAGSPGPLRPIDVADLVAESLRLSRQQIELAGFEVETSLPAVPLEVLGDRRALRSAVVNLISNAVKYGRPARWLRLSVAPVRRKGGDEVEIAVEDRGPGIPPAEISKLFEPYFRGEQAWADQIEGTGLGLGVVQDVAAAHRGRVSVESAPGRGSTFRLHLPLLATT